MITFFVCLVLGLLILLKCLGKLDLSNMGGSLVLLLGSALCVGTFTFEFMKSCSSILWRILKFDEYEGEYMAITRVMSTRSSVVTIILMCILSVPILAAVVYVIASTVYRPLKKDAFFSASEYDRQAAERTASLGMICAVVMLATAAVCLAVSIPYWVNFAYSFVLFSPLLILLLIIFTAGIGVLLLPLFFAAMNAVLFTILMLMALVCGVLYLYSAALGISSCVRAVKCGAMKTTEALICGIVMLIGGWNIISMLVVKSKLKKASQPLLLN